MLHWFTSGFPLPAPSSLKFPDLPGIGWLCMLRASYYRYAVCTDGRTW